MKKTLSLLAIITIAAAIGTQSAQAFSWSNLNPFTWGCNSRCHKQQKTDNNCYKKTPCPCSTGAAAPCDPCEKHMTQPVPCEPCDRIQQEMAK
jgi:hypothetical protein